MPSLMFVVPAHGRAELARICLRQLRRTCDALTAEGIDATAVVVADDDNLTTARALGFATVERDNRFLSRKFNDGVQYAFDPELTSPPTDVGRYEVIGRMGYGGAKPGETFEARLEPAAEQRAIARHNIRLLGRVRLTFPRDAVTPPDGWDGKPVDFVVPCGSDDFVDHRLFLNLPAPNQVLGFQRAAFVREDGAEIVSRDVAYTGGVGIRVYPRELLAPLGYRPADETRERGCDTSILVNVTRAAGGHDHLPIVYGDLHDWQIVDWKTAGQQLNSFDGITVRHRRGTRGDNPFTVLAGTYPRKALRDMRRHYANQRQAVACSTRQEEVAVNG